MKEEIVSAENVTLAFGKEKNYALSGVSFSMQRGGSIAFIGESGSGKTSMLRILLGLIEPTRGRVRLFCKYLDEVGDEELREIRRACGYIPQDPFGGLPPTLTALEAVTEPLVITRLNVKKTGRERAKELLSSLGIGETLWNRKLIQGFSGGQRQRIMLARALVTDPKLLFADEPTSMQDASTRMDLVNLIRGHHRRGMSLIFVTHDLLLAKAIAERGIVLYKGHMCETGHTGPLLKDPLHPYTMALSAALPRLGKPIEIKTKRRPLPPHWKGCPYFPLCPYASDRCHALPPLKKIGDDRSVACFLYF
ncbi:ABC transporter ATP-binding protein [Acetomicrobium sp.]|uniref:ABC transporter ATP-binding protein n=1 Tax=Acetomicrobium sp. TaxID=1872099 RepID=UPI001BCECD53|nr:ABC transporter ATP-binding protein [Acetomicrobium sp.]